MAAVSDLRTRRIPDRLILSGILLRIIFLLIRGFLPQLEVPDAAVPQNIFASLRLSASGILQSFLTALIITVPVLLLVLLTDRLLHKETLGGGDLKLIFMLALYFDFRTALYGVFFACILGVLTLLITVILRREERAFPFAPALVLGFFLALLTTSL